MRADVFMNNAWQGVFRLSWMTFHPSIYIKKIRFMETFRSAKC